MLLFLIGFLASTIGAICGIGGGVIMKPLIDAMGIMPVSEISFLSGCTILSMSLISNYKSRTEKIKSISKSQSIILILGAVIGGILGKMVFQNFKSIFANENKVGLIQSGLLFMILLATFCYTCFKSPIKTRQIHSMPNTMLIGSVLGFCSSFLGIGGGPFNLVAFEYFFSMKTKEAAKTSIYIIMFSQISALIQTILAHQVPNTNLMFAFYMIMGGVLGGYVGSYCSKKLSNEMVGKLFMGCLIFIIFISIYNMIRFM